jgi:dihydrofolate reductase
LLTLKIQWFSINYQHGRIILMRKIITTTFVTLDGVLQAPGGPQEDTSGGFTYGGWQLAWDEGDKVAEDIMTKFMETPYDLLLGRLTYDIWVAFWPKHKDEPVWGKRFDRATKYVVSKTLKNPTWEKTIVIKNNVAEELKKLKKTDGPDLCVWGSGNLIQTLLKHNLIDRMHIWTYPITIGTGKKLFAEGTRPQRFKQVDAKITTSGVVVAVYEPSLPLKSGLV